MGAGTKTLADAQQSENLPGKDVMLAFQARMADSLAENGVIDAAYAFALKQVDFNPRLVWSWLLTETTSLFLYPSVPQESPPVKYAVSNFKRSGMKPLTSILHLALMPDRKKRSNTKPRSEVIVVHCIAIAKGMVATS